MKVVTHVKLPCGRNDPCPCKSGKKLKHCCLKAHQSDALARINQQRESEEQEQRRNRLKTMVF